MTVEQFSKKKTSLLGLLIREFSVQFHCPENPHIMIPWKDWPIKTIELNLSGNTLGPDTISELINGGFDLYSIEREVVVFINRDHPNI